MRNHLQLLAIFLSAGFLAGCGQKPEVTSATTVTSRPTNPTASAKPNNSRSDQEIAFIRECLKAGLRPTLLLELENKAIREALGGAAAGGSTKSQLIDLRANFALSATQLNELATSPAAGRRAQFAQVLAKARTEQAASCSRLPDELLHGEGIGLMMIEFIKICSQAPNEQEADRRAGEHFKQNWPELINLPAQQKAALDTILKTEQEMRGIIMSLDKDPELKLVQREAATTVIRELETRASRTASSMTSESLYATLLGAGLPNRPWTFEAGEMTKLVIIDQKIVGHCIVSKIQLDARGRISGKAVSFNLALVHKTYADGRPSLLHLIER